MDKLIDQVLPKINGVPNNLIYLCYRGSMASNTYIPATDGALSVSDIDLMGVYIAPKEYYIGISQHKTLNPTTVEVKQEVDGVLYDCVFYELRHFLTMCLRCNPNVVMSLWVNPDHRLLVRHKFSLVINNRHIFISRRQLFRSFTGYADAQLKEMTLYNTNKGYMGDKRRKLVEQYGYDPKDASQLIYLLTVGIEALHNGTLNVYRTEDADLIKSIKQGKWQLDEIKLYADNLFHMSKQKYEVSCLPEEPQVDKIEKLIVMMLKVYIIQDKILDF